ncbi:metal-dependent hydrolase [Stenotrophomonas maltophilia]|uniref:metal-dependent hydrolase n=1 Tax=Stenotrophomonas maltophilia TaxID=40324 RepID=UPI0021CA56AF|nr:metal-dependent hydrolase [Stenotrophomonas maltophilia]MCU1126893.1 metal-dependent hydrolase [Stenotrophomonas maltophilia]
MDSVSQALLGACIQGALMGRTQGRRSLLYGALLGTVPDLDVIVQYADPVSNMTYHRGFSHSLFVLTIVAGLLTLVIKRIWPHTSYSAGRLGTTLLLVLVTHPLLDAFTIYGTQLFWPLARTPESWSAIFIIDPIFTIPLLAAVAISLLKGFSNKANNGLSVALMFSAAYLLFGLGARIYTEQRVHKALASQGIEIAELRSVPTPFNSLLWRTLAMEPDGHYIEAISSVFDRHMPEWIRLQRGSQLSEPLQGSPLYDRLRWFTDDWLRYDMLGDTLVVSDLRMGSPSLYTFRFAMARCGADGELTPMAPEAWPSRMANASEVGAMLRRIAGGESLPLRKWSERNQVSMKPSNGICES